MSVINLIDDGRELHPDKLADYHAVKALLPVGINGWSISYAVYDLHLLPSGDEYAIQQQDPEQFDEFTMTDQR